MTKPDDITTEAMGVATELRKWPGDGEGLRLGAADFIERQARALMEAEERGRAAERERCARIVEEMPDYLLAEWDRPGIGYRKTTRGDIAAAIRKDTP